MILRHLGKVAMGLVFCGQFASAQISVFPYSEHFDSIPDSTLPAGWQTSTNRRPGGDFFSSVSTPRSSPHCLLSQNSAVSQSLISPVFDFTNRTPDKLQFYLARSSTHTSGLLIEASTDDAATFSIALSDTLKNPGTSSYVPNTIQIPNSLANQSSVRIRWRIVGGTGGSTATFRIDDVSLATQITRDLAVGGFSVLPYHATSRDSLILSVSVKNVGVQTAAAYSVNFFCDLNNNLVCDANEVFATINGPAITPSDSTSIVAGRSPMKAGDYRFFAIVSYALDERATNDTSSVTVSVGYPQRSVLVNEIMYAPLGDEPPCQQGS